MAPLTPWKFTLTTWNQATLNQKVNDQSHKWLNDKYGQYGDVKATRGKIHDYLGMTFNLRRWRRYGGHEDYTTSIINDIPIDSGNTTAPTPAATNLFHVCDSATLDKHRADISHTFVAKGLFACKRARPDIHTTIAFLCTRVQDPTEDDWDKLLRLFHYLYGSTDEVLFLAADDLHVI
jgi:hypothetical protein